MEEVKSLLLQEKEKILAHLKKNTSKQSQSEHEIGDVIDSSVEEQGREFELLLQGREREKLEKIEDALLRIDKDDYGYCDECGESISQKRLMVLPFATHCVACQQDQEQKQRRSVFAEADARNPRDKGLFGDD